MQIPKWLDLELIRRFGAADAARSRSVIQWLLDELFRLDLITGDAADPSAARALSERMRSLTLRECECLAVSEALKRNSGNFTQAARELDVSRMLISQRVSSCGFSELVRELRAQRNGMEPEPTSDES